MNLEQKIPFSFAARERQRLTEDFHEDLYQLVNTHVVASSLSLAEVIGTLEILKDTILSEDMANTMSGDDEDEDDEAAS